jgi:DNA invertase Pin-like site-specific DNA recombinase
VHWRGDPQRLRFGFWRPAYDWHVTMIKAVAYMRTSTATNVGPDKDSETRQRLAIEAYAKHAGYQIAESDFFYDPAISGADDIDARPGFANMLARIESNGVRTIIVETANRFARDLMVQEVGYARLKKEGITLIAADSPGAFLDSGPTSTLIRQILGAVAQFEKAALVAKLSAARQRKVNATGKCSGRKSYAESNPALVMAAKGMRGSYSEISRQLAALGYVASSGKPYARAAVRSMLNQGGM